MLHHLKGSKEVSRLESGTGESLDKHVDFAKNPRISTASAMMIGTEAVE